MVRITNEIVKKIAKKFDISTDKPRENTRCFIPLAHLKAGIKEELEHGAENPFTNVIGNDITKAAKIAIAHINEMPDYYTKLAKMTGKKSGPKSGKRKATYCGNKYIKKK